MRKFVLAAIAAVSAVLLVIGAGASAQASTTPSSCFSGGTTISFSLNYTDSGGNPVWINNFGWSTSPAAQLNRISLYFRFNAADTPRLISAAGGTPETLNDVSSSAVGYADNLPYGWLNASDPEYKFNVSGGVGDSTDTCNTGWRNVP